MEEGISHEVSSLAGHQRLGNLIVVYDDNYISIEDDTNIAKSEDVAARYEAYGWHVQRLSWRTPNGYHEDVQALYQALLTAREHTEAPSFIALNTIIGWPAPHKQNTGAAHGSALGADEVAATKEVLDFDPGVDFPVEDEALAHARQVAERGKNLHAEWEQSFAAWSAANADRRALFDRLAVRQLPDGWAEALPSFPADAKGMATRKASGAILGALAPVLPELWGGSADLAESNLTTMEGEPSFIPVDHQTAMWRGNPYGRTLHFGIREHGMGAILNGIALHGGTRPYGGTFLVFSDYMRGSVRLVVPDGAAGHLRVDARLRRPGRRRADPPADRAPVGAACHPAPGGDQAGRRERDRGGLADDPGTGPAVGPVPDPAEPSGRRPVRG